MMAENKITLSRKTLVLGVMAKLAVVVITSGGSEGWCQSGFDVAWGVVTRSAPPSTPRPTCFAAVMLSYSTSVVVVVDHLPSL